MSNVASLRLRLVSKYVQQGKRPSASVFGNDNENKAKAYSFLRSLPTQDRQPLHLSDLSNEQAHDVAAWPAHFHRNPGR